MLRSSFQPHVPQPASVPADSESISRRFMRAIQEFWRFSKFYGEFVSTPIRYRKLR